ncbi:MAG: DUF2628 domain-containing protein [Janthinobacterium lividum]
MIRRYTVHVRPAPAVADAGAAPRIAGVTLVPERFSWGALFLGPVWFAAVGAWLPAVGVAALWVACGALFPPAVAAVVVLQGLLGQDLRRWSLRRRGLAMAGVVVAPGREAAMARLLDARADLRDGWMRSVLAGRA